jgi:outer membrane translocation and assembly module TamA
VPIGGEGLWLASLELRYRLTPRWRLVGFTDVGDVTADPLRISPAEAHVAVGAGIRLFTLAGPIRLDIAYRADRRSRVALDTGELADRRTRDFLSFVLTRGEAF